MLYFSNNRFFGFHIAFLLQAQSKKRVQSFPSGAALFIQLVKEHERGKRKCIVSWMRTSTLWRIGLTFNQRLETNKTTCNSCQVYVIHMGKISKLYEMKFKKFSGKKERLNSLSFQKSKCAFVLVDTSAGKQNICYYLFLLIISSTQIQGWFLHQTLQLRQSRRVWSVQRS